MKKKIICIAICILIFMGACVCVYNNYSKKEVSSTNEEIIENNEDVIINKDEEQTIDNKVDEKEKQEKQETTETNDEKKSDLVQPKEESSNNQTSNKKENIHVEEQIHNENNYKEENTNIQIIEQTKHEEQTVQPEVIDNSVDTNSLDYNEHRGRIDCYSSDECMNISLPMQFKFKKSITNSQYITVMSKSGNVLGYFIEYMFKENTYSSSEECENIGREIKQTLSDKVTSYQCNGSTLKIYTSY